MKRILFINSSLSGGGSEKVMTILANQFSAMGYRVAMAILVDGPEQYKLDSNIEKHCIGSNTSGVKMRVNRLRYLRQLIKSFQPEFIISFMTQVNIYTLMAAIGLEKVVLVSERANPSKRRAILHLIENSLYLIFASGVVFQTEQVKAHYLNGIRKKSCVIPNPVKKSSVVVDSSKNLENKCIVAVGRLEPQKNFTLLIRAFSLIAEKYPAWILKIYGKGSERDYLNGLICSLGLRGRVLLEGHVSDVVSRMSEASIYVSSSDYEGISNSMLEAMSMGLPVICTNCPVGGAEMMIDDHINGLLVPVGSESKLANAIEELITSDSLMNKISNQALKIIDDYSVVKIASTWETYMLSLNSSNKA